MAQGNPGYQPDLSMDSSGTSQDSLWIDLDNQASTLNFVSLGGGNFEKYPNSKLCVLQDLSGFSFISKKIIGKTSSPFSNSEISRPRIP